MKPDGAKRLRMRAQSAKPEEAKRLQGQVRLRFAARCASERGNNFFLHFYAFQTILSRLRHPFFLIFRGSEATENASAKRRGSEATEQSCRASLRGTKARVVCRKKKFDHISPILNALHWLPVEKRIQYKVLCNAQKFVTGQVPEYFDDLLNLYKPARPLRSSNKTLLEVPPLKEVKTHKFGERKFSYIAPALYIVQATPESEEQ